MSIIIKILLLTILVIIVYQLSKKNEKFSIIDNLQCGLCSTKIKDDNKIWPNCRRKGFNTYLGASLDLPPICR